MGIYYLESIKTISSVTMNVIGPLFFFLKFSQDGDVFNHFDIRTASLSVSFYFQNCSLLLFCICHIFYLIDILQIGIVKHFCPLHYYFFILHLEILKVRFHSIFPWPWTRLFCSTRSARRIFKLKLNKWDSHFLR